MKKTIKYYNGQKEMRYLIFIYIQSVIFYYKQYLMQGELLIRKEKPEDYAEVENIVRDAFWNLLNPGTDKHYLVHILRKSKEFIPQLSLVAEINEQIVGYIIYTRSYVSYEGNLILPTVTFGPVCVRPNKQMKGIGEKLIKQSLKMAYELGHKGVIILGSPLYYNKFGFVLSKQFGVKTPNNKFYIGMQILQLEKGYFPVGKQGVFHYSQCFTNINNQDFNKFDAKFSQKQKFRTKSQQAFDFLSQLEWHDRNLMYNVSKKDSVDRNKIQ